MDNRANVRSSYGTSKKTEREQQKEVATIYIGEMLQPKFSYDNPKQKDLTDNKIYIQDNHHLFVFTRQKPVTWAFSLPQTD
jgi:hypothetical protein